MRKSVWRDLISLPWCGLGSSNTTSLGVPGQEDMDGKVKAEEAIPILPPHRFILSGGRNLLFQKICGLLNPKRYKGTESQGWRDTGSNCSSMQNSSQQFLC